MEKQIKINISWVQNKTNKIMSLMDRLTASESNDHEMQLILSHLITFPAF